MFGALLKAIRQIGDRRLRGVTLLMILIGIGLHVGLIAIATVVFDASNDEDWLAVLGKLGGFFAVFFIPTYFYPSIVTAIFETLFVERVCVPVESRWYPGRSPARTAPIREATWMAIRLAVVGVVVNVLALPLYIALLITGLAFLLGYAINGHLLGREFYEIVAVRRVARVEADVLRKRYGKSIWLAGALIAFLYTVPLLNLVVPVVATAFMLHLFEHLRAKDSAAAPLMLEPTRIEEGVS